MRRTLARITLTAAATAGLAATTYVQALGLGEINVSSDLNQRFVASIPLTEISAEDLETVTVSVAPNEAFDRAGIERAEYLSSLNFEIKNDGGRPRVIVTSSQIAREPVLDLLVQARWSGGKILRDYTILLDPPTSAVARAPAPVAAPPVAAPAPVIAVAPAPAKPVAAKPVVPVGGEFYETPTETKPVKKPAATKPAPAATDDAYDSATGSYGPVAPKETLWSIATKVRPGPAVSMDQVLLALSEANPIAIQRGTTVSKGAMLRVPSAERIQSTSAETAKAKLLALRGGKVAAAKPTASAKAPVEKAAAPKPAEAAPKPQGAALPAAPVAASTRPELPKPQIALPPTPKPAEPSAAAAKPATPVIATPPPAAAPATPAPAVTAPAAAEPAVTTAPAASAPTPEAAPASAAPAPAAPVESPAASTTAATAPEAAPAPAKSPLAQPLPEESSPGFLDEYGLPLGVAALVVLLGGVFMALSRRRKAAAPSKNFTQFKPGDTSSVVAPAGGAGALGKLGDTARVSTDTQALGSREMAAAAAYGSDSTQQMTQPVQPASAASDLHQSTLILDPEAMATLNNAVKQSAVTGGTDSFDKTMQVQVDTLHINLGDNDPLSEADFHLAYGLYDEAILLLKTATQEQPQRTDLKVKLAETYFAAGRPMEFQEIAEELKDKLSAGEWSKLAIMGSQICPDVALFQSAEGDAGLDADFDLAFDEPETPAPSPAPAASSGSIEFSLSAPAMLSTPAPVAAPVVIPSDLKLSLDDDFDDDDKDSSKPALPPAGLDDDASIDFMLGQSLTPLGAGMKVPDASELSFNLGSPALNVPLPKVDITRSDMGSDAAMSERPTLTPGGGMSLSLQDLEVSITPRQPTVESADDDLNTKLDLARAYVEMGDNDMARSLLQEVQQQGGDRHQQEAASLLQRLPA